MGSRTREEREDLRVGGKKRGKRRGQGKENRGEGEAGKEEGKVRGGRGGGRDEERHTREERCQGGQDEGVVGVLVACRKEKEILKV